MNDQQYPYRKSWRWNFVRFFDFLLDPFSKRLKQAEFPKSVRNILIVRSDHIGDLICSLPVLPVLKRRFPNAKITLLAGEDGKAILAENPFVDRLVVFSPNWFSRRKLVNPVQFFEVISELRKSKYDLGFDLRGDLRNIVLMTLAGVRYRIGYGIAGGGGLLNKIGQYNPALHQVELNLKLVTDEAIPKRSAKPEIYLSPEEREVTLKKLKVAGIPEGTRLVAICPEAGYPSKEWEEEKFVALIQKLLTDPRVRILVFGLSGRASRIAQYDFAFLPHPNPLPSATKRTDPSFGGEGEGRVRGQNRVIDLVEKLSLREMIVALSHCQLFIGNDSGPSHIAQALGIPVVVIASGTNEYDKWGIWREPSKVLKYAVPCSPCHLQYCNVTGHPCMSQISADEVWQAAQELVSVGRS